MTHTPRRRHMMALGAAIAISTVATHPAYAQSSCGSRDQVIDDLAQSFGETVMFRGLKEDGTRMMEMTVSPAGTWTIVLSEPQGATCVIAFGVVGEFVAPGETPHLGV